MYFGVIIGIDDGGRYVTVRKVNGTVEVVALSINDVFEIGSIYYKDAIMESKCSNYLSFRMNRSLLLSFEDDLLVVDDANILWVSDNEDGSCDVRLEVNALDEPYSEYIEDRDKTRAYIVKNIVVRLNRLSRCEGIGDLDGHIL